jgi:hypothetical protein
VGHQMASTNRIAASKTTSRSASARPRGPLPARPDRWLDGPNEAASTIPNLFAALHRQSARMRIGDASAGPSTDRRAALGFGMIHAVEVSPNSGAPIDPVSGLRRCSQRHHACGHRD